VSSGVAYAFSLAAVFAAFAVVIADRPEKRPGNLAPIQLITALGAWALIVVNSVVAGLACVTGSAALAIAPVATILCAAVLFARGAGPERSARSLPDSVDAVIGEIRDLLGGARRLGLHEIDAVLTGNGPQIGVTVPSRGRVVVRIHESLVPWIDRHRRRSAATIGSFIRFAVLHELGHILNGDHRTFRFARSVLIAHLWWLLAAPLAVVSGNAGAIVFATVFVTLLVTVQSLIARQFIAERERLADWRAMQSLSMEDASRLLRRSGIAFGGGPAPTEAEKLMIDLKAVSGPASRSSYSSRVIRVLWPEGDNIHQRAEAMAEDRAGAPARPVRWAGLTGFQCGVLATSVAMGIFLVAGWMQNDMDIWTLMIPMMWIGGPAVAYCVMRTDPARMSVSGRSHRRIKIETSVTFALAFVSGMVVTDRFAHLLRIPVWVPGLFMTALIVTMPFVICVFAWFAGITVGDSGGGDLRVVPRDRWVGVMPLLAASAIVLIPLNVAVSYRLGLGVGWVAILFCAFGAYVLSTGMARSTRAFVRALAPVGMLDTPAPVYGFRFFWREFFLDITRVSLVRAVVVALVFQIVVLLLFVVVFAFAMRAVVRLADFSATFVVFFFFGFTLFSLILLIPDRVSGIPRRIIRLIDRNRLELFVALLKSARHADESAGERIRNALALRLPFDRPAMSLLLPDRRSLWMLSSLSTYLRLVRAAGAVGIIDHIQGPIEAALRDVVTDDAVSVAPGEPPSLFYSTLAAAIIDEAGLRGHFPFERMIDRIGAMLGEQLSGENVNLLADVVGAARLLQAHGRTIPDTVTIGRFVQRSTLMSKPVRQQSLVELCELADLLGDEKERERLAPIVRSRMWEILQLNPRKEVLALLDCYLAAVRIGERESMVASAAGLTIAEIATRTADELTGIARPMREAS
jgi:hypothetical protein